MKWVRTAEGRKAHALCHGAERTLCHIAVEHVTGIVSTPSVDDKLERCAECDAEWRHRGREAIKKIKRKAPPSTRTSYKPRFTFERHWETLQ